MGENKLSKKVYSAGTLAAGTAENKTGRHNMLDLRKDTNADKMDQGT